MREKDYKEVYLQPPNLDHTRKNREVITRTLKSPLKELRPIWPLDTLSNLEELVELKKIKQRYYMWKKCYGKDNECVMEDNEKETSDNGGSGFEVTLLASKETFEPHNFCFGGHK